MTFKTLVHRMDSWRIAEFLHKQALYPHVAFVEIFASSVEMKFMHSMDIVMVVPSLGCPSTC